MHFKRPRFRLAALLLLLALTHAPREARAQTSILTVPTGDVLADGESELSFEFETRPVAVRNGGFRTFGLFLVHGARKGLEVGVNAYFTKDGEESEPVELQSNIKVRLYESEEKGVAAAAGAVLYAPTGRGSGDTLRSEERRVGKECRSRGGT